MKMSMVFSVCLFVVQAAFGGGVELTGDTLGAAATNISSLQSSLDHILKPENTIGNSGVNDEMTLAKTVCAELGSAIGFAFAVQTEITLYTPGYFAEASGLSGEINSQKNSLINVLTDSRNEYCNGNSTDLAKVKTAVIKAKAIAAAVSALLSAASRR